MTTDTINFAGATAGFWHVGGNGTIVYDCDGRAICNATVFHGKNEVGQSEINALLLAASPQILAERDALRVALDRLLVVMDAEPARLSGCYAVTVARETLAKCGKGAQ